ncbi:MAG: hypothetical protein PVG63_01800 [Anaerolineales bacterium]|jgi:hypothetical protein
MDENYIPPITHLNPLVTIRRSRKLPVSGTIIARVNERVTAEDILAEAEPDPRLYYLDVARGLGISEKQVGRYLTRDPGDRLDAGEIIAGPVGVGRRTIRAPYDGRIVAISKGRVLFEARGENYSLKAGFPGTVVSTDGSRELIIETTGALLQAVWGNGKHDFGVMRAVGDGPDSTLQTGNLDIGLRGAVLFAGMCDQSAPFHQATELAVKGVILGSIDSHLIGVVRRLDYPVVVIEGFGQLPINQAAYKLLSSNVGREVAVEASTPSPYGDQRPEVVIPLPPTKSADLPSKIVRLSPGVRVRVIREPHMGAVGTVKELIDQAVRYQSGVLAHSVTVELEGIGRETMPVSNVEVYQ